MTENGRVRQPFRKLRLQRKENCSCSGTWCRKTSPSPPTKRPPDGPSCFPLTCRQTSLPRRTSTTRQHSSTRRNCTTTTAELSSRSGVRATSRSREICICRRSFVAVCITCTRVYHLSRPTRRRTSSMGCHLVDCRMARMLPTIRYRFNCRHSFQDMRSTVYSIPLPWMMIMMMMIHLDSSLATLLSPVEVYEGLHTSF